MFDLWQHIYNKWQPEAAHVDAQRGPPLYVSVLSEDIQNERQLQETHENTQVWRKQFQDCLQVSVVIVFQMSSASESIHRLQ